MKILDNYNTTTILNVRFMYLVEPMHRVQAKA